MLVFIILEVISVIAYTSDILLEMSMEVIVEKMTFLLKGVHTLGICY